MIDSTGLLDRLRARKAPIVTADELDARLDRIQARWAAERPVEDAGEADRPATRRKRKLTLISVAKQAAKAGLEVARYEIDPDGRISIVTGKPVVADGITGNPWDRVLQ